MKVTGLDDLVNNMPPAFKGLIGDLTLLESFDTYMASQLFDIRLPLIGGIMSIILGLALSSAEEETGELRTTLALPISRTKLLLHKWLAIVLIGGVMTLGIALGAYAVIPFIDDANLPWDMFMHLLLLSWLLIVTFGTIPFAAGMITGKRAAAMAIGVVVVIGSFILTTFGQAVDWLADFEKFSLLYYFPANDIAQGTLEWGNGIVLSGLTLGLLIAAIIVFRRRDIG
jgi:ABC-2 type transport system permease protein